MAYAPQFSRPVRRRRNLNLTSLIDVVFLLVLFFMLTSKFMVSEMMDMSLTTLEGGGGAEASSAAIVITLTGDKQFILAGQTYPLTELKTHIQQALKAGNTEDVVLVSRKGVTVQEIITAMDEIKLSGGRNVSVAEEVL